MNNPINNLHNIDLQLNRIDQALSTGRNIIVKMNNDNGFIEIEQHRTIFHQIYFYFKSKYLHRGKNYLTVFGNDKTQLLVQFHDIFRTISNQFNELNQIKFDHHPEGVQFYEIFQKKGKDVSARLLNIEARISRIHTIFHKNQLRQVVNDTQSIKNAWIISQKLNIQSLKNEFHQREFEIFEQISARSFDFGRYNRKWIQSLSEFETFDKMIKEAMSYATGNNLSLLRALKNQLYTSQRKINNEFLSKYSSFVTSERAKISQYSLDFCQKNRNLYSQYQIAFERFRDNNNENQLNQEACHRLIENLSTLNQTFQAHRQKLEREEQEKAVQKVKDLQRLVDIELGFNNGEVDKDFVLHYLQSFRIKYPFSMGENYEGIISRLKFQIQEMNIRELSLKIHRLLKEVSPSIFDKILNTHFTKGNLDFLGKFQELHECIQQAREPHFKKEEITAFERDYSKSLQAFMNKFDRYFSEMRSKSKLSVEECLNAVHRYKEEFSEILEAMREFSEFKGLVPPLRDRFQVIIQELDEAIQAKEKEAILQKQAEQEVHERRLKEREKQQPLLDSRVAKVLENYQYFDSPILQMIKAQKGLTLEEVIAKMDKHLIEMTKAEVPHSSAIPKISLRKKKVEPYTVAEESISKEEQMAAQNKIKALQDKSKQIALLKHVLSDLRDVSQS